MSARVAFLVAALALLPGCSDEPDRVAEFLGVWDWTSGGHESEPDCGTPFELIEPEEIQRASGGDGDLVIAVSVIFCDTRLEVDGSTARVVAGEVCEYTFAESPVGVTAHAIRTFEESSLELSDEGALLTVRVVVNDHYTYTDGSPDQDCRRTYSGELARTAL